VTPASGAGHDVRGGRPVSGSSEASRSDDTPVVVIEAQPETVIARLLSLWRFRGFYGFLFKELTMRRARGSMFGVWSLILRPLVPALGLIFAFGSVTPVETGLPYPVFFLSGYIPWQLFQSSLRILPRALSWSRSIMRRTYFPRLLVPLAGFGLPLLEFFVLTTAFVVVVLLETFRGNGLPLQLGWQTLWLIPCLLGVLLFALAFGLVFGVIALFFRDAIFSLRYFVQVMLFLTPVLYPVTVVPEHYRWVLYALNPMAQIVLVSRWSLTGHGEFHLGFFLLSLGTVLVSIALGVIFFLRAEVQLGDQM